MKEDIKKGVRVFLKYIGGRAEGPVEVTGRLTKVGPLVRTRESTPGVPSTATFSLEMVPEDDKTTGGDGDLFECSLIICELYWTASRSGRPPSEDEFFYGVLKGSPKSLDSVDERRVVINFVGALAALWDDNEVELFDNDRAYVDLETDILAALLSQTKLPVDGVDIRIPFIETDEPFWSPIGRPPAYLLGITEDERSLYEVRGLAWDEGRSLVYVGFGPFICGYAGVEWSVVGRVGYAGDGLTLKSVGWRVVYLEYDSDTDKLLGAAETGEDDIRERTAHVKARFVVEL
jgi:hypothetical protein